MKFDYNAEYFNPKDVLESGQTFRYFPKKDGYFVISADKACYVATDGIKTVVESDEPEYFYNYFDLATDYAARVKRALSFQIPALSLAALKCKGLRLLKQNAEETVYSFILSQNNNIPRIKSVISRICRGLGEKKLFMGEEYYAFPSSRALAEKNAEFYRSAGAGYRDKFIAETAAKIAAEGISHLYGLNAADLKRQLTTYRGVGDKVADCICLFGFGKTENFPVDVWIEKIYKEDFGGTLTDRKQINRYFTSLFGEDSGYVQQVLFYAKRANL